MEIVIILLLIAAVAFVVYFQLQGVRQEVTPLQHLGTGKRAAAKKEAPKKEVVEQWDTLEVSKKSKKGKKTDDESPKKKKKERFDPIAEGKKITKSETLKKRETVAKADDEKTVEEVKAEKQVRNRLAADGFVVIDEKKPKAKKVKTDEVASPVAKVEEKAPLSEFEQRLERLREVVNRTARPQQDGDRKEGDFKPRGDRKEGEETKTDIAPEKKNDIMQKQIREIREKATGVKAAVKGGVIKSSAPTTAISAPSSGKRGWEKVAKKAAPAPVEEEVVAEESAVEEAAAPADEDAEWGAEPVETEEF